MVAPNVGSTEVEKGVLRDPETRDVAPCVPRQKQPFRWFAGHSHILARARVVAYI